MPKKRRSPKDDINIVTNIDVIPMKKDFTRETLQFLGKKFRKNQKYFSVKGSKTGLVSHLRIYIEDNYWGPAQRLAMIYLDNWIELTQYYLERHEVSKAAWRIFNNLELRQLIEILTLLGYRVNDIALVIEYFMPKLTVSAADIKDYCYWFWNFIPDPGKTGNYARRVMQFIKNDSLLSQLYEKYLKIIESDYTIAEIMIDLGIPVPEKDLMDLNYYTLCLSTMNTKQELKKGHSKKAYRQASISHRLLENNRLIGGDNNPSAKILLKVSHDEIPEDANIIEVDGDV